MSTSNPVVKVYGTEETTVCECCGKTNLKATVVLGFEDGQILRYGKTCAGRAIAGVTKATKATNLEGERMMNFAQAVVIANKFIATQTPLAIARHISVKGLAAFEVRGEVVTLYPYGHPEIKHIIQAPE